MQNVTTQNFRDGGVTPPWRTIGDWHTENGDATARDRSCLACELPEPYRRVEIEFEVSAEDADTVCASIDRYCFSLATETGGVSAVTGNLGRIVGQAPSLRLPLDTWQRICVGSDPEGVWLGVEGEAPIRFADAQAPACVSDVSIHGTRGMRVRNIVLTGEPLPQSDRPRPRQPARFSFAMAVDFPGDLVVASRPFEEQDLRALVAKLDEWGIRRIYWMYNGEKRFGMWDQFALFFPHIADRAKATFENVSSPLSVVVDEAHRRGMEAYAIVKPFDLANNLKSLPDDPSRLPPGPKRLWRPGGYCTKVPPFLMEHPDLLMQRHPYGTDPSLHDKVVRKIKIYSHDDAPFRFTPSDMSLLVSDDNETYRPYPKPVRCEEVVEERSEVIPHWAGNRAGPSKTRVRALMLDGLELTEKYFAVKLPTDRPGAQLTNRLAALAELFTEGDESIPFTLGLEVQSSLVGENGGWAWRQTTLEEGGANFEHKFGVPAFCSHRLGMCSWWAIDHSCDFLAFCRGKGRLMYALSFAHEESRRFLQGYVRECLKTGVDGVDIRLNSHNSTIEPQAYGFNAPIVEEFRKRYGVDVLTEDFDWHAWQSLQGEYLTQLMRDISALLRQEGRAPQVHLGYFTTMSEREPCFMNIHHDWASWLKEGLVDAITHKDDSVNSPLCAQIRELPTDLGLPLYGCYRHGCGLPGEEWAALEGRMAQRAAACGMDGVILYENAEAMRLTETPGVFEVTAPEIAEVIRSLRR